MRDVALLCVVCVAVVAFAFGVAGSAAAESEEANVTVYPAGDKTFENATDIENAVLEAGAPAYHGELLVIEIESERLADDLDERTGSTTDRFFAVENTTFELVQRGAGPMLAPIRSIPGLENSTVYRNGTTAYVVVDSGALEYRNFVKTVDTIEDSRISNGINMTVVFGYGLEMARTSNPPDDAPEFEFYTNRAWLTAPDRSLPLIPSVNELAVRMYTEPDDSVELRVLLDDGTTISDSVSGEGDLAWSLDLRDVSLGTEYTLELLFDGDVINEYEGTVTAPEASLRNAKVVEATTDEMVVNVTAEVTHPSDVLALTEDGETLTIEKAYPGEQTVSLTVNSANPDYPTDKLQIRIEASVFAPMDSYEGDDTELTVDLTDVIDESEVDNVNQTDRTVNGDGQADKTPTPTPASKLGGAGTNDGGAADGEDDGGAGDNGFGDGLTVVTTLVALALAVAIARQRQFQ